MTAVIPGRAGRREPGIHNHGQWLWIPGSLATLGPRNDSPGLAWWACRWYERSIDLQPQRFDHRRPERDVGGERAAEFLGRGVGRGLDTALDQQLLVGALGNHRARRLRDPLDEGGGCP